MSSNAFDVAENLFKKKQSPGNNKNPFDVAESQFQKKPTENEEAIRHGTRSLARGAETLLGLPGDIVDLLRSGFAYGAKKLGGKGGEALSALIKESPSGLTPPTSVQLKEVTGNLSKGFTEPQSENEKFADDIISDITSLALPVKGKIPFVKSIGTALAGNYGKEFVKQGGGSELAQDATKLGTFFLAGLKGGQKADKFVSNLYEDAKSKIPSGTMIPTGVMDSRLSTLANELKKGKSTATKKQVLADVEEIKAKISGGAYPAEDLVQTYHDINETMSSKKLFDELSSTERRLLKKRTDALKDVVSKELTNYGQYNPEFLDTWRSANEAFRTIQDSKKVSKMLQTITKTKPALAGTPALILFEAMNPQTIIPTAATLGAGYGVLKTGELGYRFAKSPTLRKHYLNIIDNSINGNTAAVISNLENLNKELEKDQSKESSE